MNDSSFQCRLSQPCPLGADRAWRRETLTLADGYETSIYLHQPRGEKVRLPVLYVHGIQSHPGWFAGSAAALADRGHRVYQPTRRGSGDNHADRGHARSAAQLLDDVESAARFALADSGADRLHLVGVSWGGKLLVCHAATRPASIEAASLTLVTPGIVPRVDVSAGVKLAIAACLLIAPRRRFEIPLADAELFTDNEQMQRYIRGDRFALRRATARFLFASRCLDRRLLRAPAGAIRLPTTLLLAERDRIIDSDATLAVLERCVSAPMTVRRFQTDHTLEFDRDPQPYYDALATALQTAETEGE